MVGVPGFVARFWARFLTRVFGQGFLGQKIQFYTTTGTEKYTFTDGEYLEKNHVLKNPIYFKIPYIKNPVYLKSHIIKNPIY